METLIGITNQMETMNNNLKLMEQRLDHIEENNCVEE